MKLSEIFKEQVNEEFKLPYYEDRNEDIRMGASKLVAEFYLDKITPKVAIDFANWCGENYRTPYGLEEREWNEFLSTYKP